MIRTMILAATLPFCALNAQAEIETEALATCLMTHTTDEQAEGMKRFMIHALQQEKAGATEELLKFSFGTLATGTSKCGLSFADIDTPDFEAAMEIYGQQLGEKIMSEAMLLIDIPVD